MSDDLVYRLRAPDPYRETTERLLMGKAADRIEELERHIELRDFFLTENDLWEKFAKGTGEKAAAPLALVIEEGKHYVTTRGKIVGPIKRQLSSLFPWGANGMEWGERGNYFIDPRETKDFDIVAEHHVHGREVINDR